MRRDANARVVGVLDAQFTRSGVFPNLGAVVEGFPIYAAQHKRPINSQLQAAGIGLAGGVWLVGHALFACTDRGCGVDAYASC